MLALARMLSHKDPSVTLRVYADLFDTDLDAVAGTLHRRYFPENAAKKPPRGGRDGDEQTTK